MTKTTALACVAVLGLAYMPAHAAAVVTFSPGSVTAAQVQAAGGVTVNIVVTGFPAASNPCTGMGFHLTYDKTKLSIDTTSVTWNTTALPGWTSLTPVPKSDGLVIAGGSISGVTVPSAATTVVSFTLSAVAGQDPTGTMITFNAEDTANNALLDADGNPIDGTDFSAIFNVNAGPPNPAQNPTLSITPLPPTAVHDSANPFSVSVSWTTGVGKDVQIQYNTSSGFPSDGSSQGTITNLSAPGTSPLTFNWASGLNIQHAIDVRVRVLDQGDVWNGTTYVDAAANPTVGWTSGTVVDVDNVAPTLSSASATGGSANVVVTFSEAVTDATALVAGNYTVKNGATPITVNSAVAAGTGKVQLTLASTLDIANAGQYTVAATGISDTAGNVAGALGPIDITFKPILQSASFVQNSAKNQVDAVFSNAMSASTVNTASSWSLSVGSGTPPTVTTAALQNDNKTVLLTLSAALAMNTSYTVTCPSTAADASTAVTVGSDNTADFTTPYWHDFATGVSTIGVSLLVGPANGQVNPSVAPVHELTTLLGASKIASFDQTLNSGAGGYNVDPNTEVDYLNGMGFFARFNAATTAFFPAGTTTNSGAVSLPAVQGWNIITNPFGSNININWASATGSGSTPLEYGWYYNGTSYELAANIATPNTGIHITADPTLQPWRGYFVYAPANTTAIDISATAPTGTVKPLQIGGKTSTLIQLVARAGNSVDDTNVCGVGPNALEIANPPYMPGSVDLAILDDNGNPQALDIKTGSVTGKWNLLVTTDLANTKVTVSTPDLSSVPADDMVILSDPDTGQKCAMRTSAGLTFTTGATGASKKLVLQIVPRSNLTMVTGVSVAQADAGHVVVTYQLSGAAAVSASVMNIAGRVIRVLETSSTETAGTHTLSWDLANSAGSAVPRGTYLLKLQAQTEDGQQAQTVRTFAVNR